jgi:hypothetical protein
MYAKLMQASDSARTVLRLGCCVLGFAALAGIWETFASQAPVAALRETALQFGALLVLAGLLLGERTLPARWLWCLWLGLLLTLGSASYAAATGMHAVQVRDLRPEAIWLFIAKFIGRGLLCACLIEIAWRVLARRRA